MKKLFALLLALLLPVTGALADVLTDDWRGADDAEIQAAIDELNAELQSRTATRGSDDGNMILYEQDGITVTMTGENYAFTDLFYIGVIVENNSNRDIMVTLRDASVNGWETSTLAPGKVQAGNKKKADMTFNFGKAGITSETEIQNIKYVLTVIDADSFELIGATEHLTWTPDN